MAQAVRRGFGSGPTPFECVQRVGGAAGVGGFTGRGGTGWRCGGRRRPGTGRPPRRRTPGCRLQRWGSGVREQVRRVRAYVGHALQAAAADGQGMGPGASAACLPQTPSCSWPAGNAGKGARAGARLSQLRTRQRDRHLAPAGRLAALHGRHLARAAHRHDACLPETGRGGRGFQCKRRQAAWSGPVLRPGCARPRAEQGSSRSAQGAHTKRGSTDAERGAAPPAPAAG